MVVPWMLSIALVGMALCKGGVKVDELKAKGRFGTVFIIKEISNAESAAEKGVPLDGWAEFPPPCASRRRVAKSDNRVLLFVAPVEGTPVRSRPAGGSP
jgi:hypothetical protein